MDQLLAGLRAAAEPTRLRLLALCARAELTVTELTQILGQSQPRVSRHLKLLCEAGLLERFREGAWAFYRLAQRGQAAPLADHLVALLPTDDPGLALDLDRLEGVKRSRARRRGRIFPATMPASGTASARCMSTRPRSSARCSPACPPASAMRPAQRSATISISAPAPAGCSS